MESSQVQDFLQCIICLEIAKKAMECEQCNNLMCEECITILKKRECPSCRKFNFAVKPSVLARRMIGSMPAECPNACGENSTVGNLDDHLKKCANRVYLCTGGKGFFDSVNEECKFEGKKEEFLKHLIEKHEK